MAGELHPARTFRAPGRVNLIGEHTDYNDGYVLPVAIDRYTWVTAAPGADATVRAWSENLVWGMTVDQDTTPRKDWGDYLRGVVALLRERGLARLGAEMLIRSELPLGGGLSSSAALEVACAYALLSLNHAELPPLELASLCRRAEQEWAGMRCGIMDQYCATHARRGAALLLDCRSLESHPVPLPDGQVEIVVANTMVKRELAHSTYNDRRRECEEAARLLGVPALRDAGAEATARLPEPFCSRARHVIEENQRVLAFAEALARPDWQAVGDLMAASHESLKTLYQVSCEELDFMVENGRELGSLGSRMTGAGFGGCTVHFVPSSGVTRFLGELAARYQRRFRIDPQMFVVHPGSAVEEVRPVG